MKKINYYKEKSLELQIKMGIKCKISLKMLKMEEENYLIKKICFNIQVRIKDTKNI